MIKSPDPYGVEASQRGSAEGYGGFGITELSAAGVVLSVTRSLLQRLEPTNDKSLQLAQRIVSVNGVPAFTRSSIVQELEMAATRQDEAGKFFNVVKLGVQSPTQIEVSARRVENITVVLVQGQTLDWSFVPTEGNYMTFSTRFEHPTGIISHPTTCGEGCPLKWYSGTFVATHDGELTFDLDNSQVCNRCWQCIGV